ncbi:hypothetical protein B0H17DRAFT_1283695 [Mycena rosella]|uniref:Secreted protein n=1 Tax=Mycena rosella TaxID=1033263 RepID=A0AAD7GKQ0_MYCRO|nr:hypothetical protein B0H17DRAFT_1283695 [Mycena rosella]
MFSRLTTALALALALALVSFSAPAVAISPCGVCSPFMFFSGVNRTLELQREEEMNTVQCDYSGGNLPSPIVIPYCLYAVNFSSTLGRVNNEASVEHQRCRARHEHRADPYLGPRGVSVN